MKYLRQLIIFVSFTLPSAILLAQATAANSSLVPTCTDPNQCNWTKLFELFQNILNWFIWASIPVATIAIAYAGWKIIWGSTNPSSVSEGKKILQDTLIGLAAVLAATLIVKAILQYLTKDPQYQNFID